MSCESFSHGPNLVRLRVLASLLGCLCLFANPSIVSIFAQDASASNSDEVAIRQSAADFVAAFNRHDAKAIAQLWTENGEYVDEVGQRYEGRKAIEQEYDRFFQDHQGTKIEVSIDSIRFLGPGTAIEDGSAALVPPPPGATGNSKYIAIHVKQDDGRWLLASVRDIHTVVPSSYGNLRHLDFLVGEWSAEHAGTQADVTCKWNPQKSFLERRFVVTRGGAVISSSTEIIAWDPITRQISSWTFSSDGGRAVGRWTALEDGWVVVNEGVTSSGTRTESVDFWAPLLDGALGWSSTGRTVGGTRLQDSKHVVLKKKTSKQSESE